MANRCGGPLPDRWLHCPKTSLDLIQEKFLAFKTPLNSSFDDKLPGEKRFLPKDAFDAAKRLKAQLGLWIDLTNSKRFYTKQDVENEGDCRYSKQSCRGHGETPGLDQTKVFIHTVTQFVMRNPKKIIGVHCTHGFNRTGFLIVSYLVEQCDIDLHRALEIFASSRPPGIYKQDYIDELFRRYKKKPDDNSDDDDDEYEPVTAPEKPDWSDDAFAEEANCSTNVQNGPRRKVPTFMEGVKGVTFFDEQPKAAALKKMIQLMCGWKNKTFPGSQPVSMDLDNMNYLHDKEYMVSWKADGMRYMMLIDTVNEVYFFDRDNNVFKVDKLAFLYRKDLKQHLTKTLLDGEMVIDKVNGESIARYLVYDIVRINNTDVSKEPFSRRYDIIVHEIINPRYLAMERGIIIKQHEPFSVRRKEFWHVTQAANLLGEKFAKSLSHEPDGLIFQPAQEPYVAGTCEEVLKWKPIEMNSVDFRLKIMKVTAPGMIPERRGYLYVGQFEQPFASMNFTKEIKEHDNKIIECKLENNQWKFMRVRTDKSIPNSFKTAEAVLKSIKAPVTKDILLNFIQHHRYHVDSEIMPPPSKRVRR